MYIVPLIPAWFTAIVMFAILLLCIVVLYILLRDEYKDWKRDRNAREKLKGEGAAAIITTGEPINSQWHPVKEKADD